MSMYDISGGLFPKIIGVFHDNGHIICPKHVHQYSLLNTCQPATDLDRIGDELRICPYCSRNRPIYEHEYLCQRSRTRKEFEVLNLTMDNSSGHDDPEIVTYLNTYEQFERWIEKLPFVHFDLSDRTHNLWAQAIVNEIKPKLRNSGYMSGPLGSGNRLQLIAVSDPTKTTIRISEENELFALTEGGPMLDASGGGAVISDWCNLTHAELEKVYETIPRMS